MTIEMSLSEDIKTDNNGRYLCFKESVEKVLKDTEEPMTWGEIKEIAGLRHYRPQSAWVTRLETEIGLVRNRKSGEVLWSIKQ